MITFLKYLKYQDGGVSTENVGEVWPTERKGSFLWRRQKKKKKKSTTSHQSGDETESGCWLSPGEGG